jgi:hypothetical protein
MEAFQIADNGAQSKECRQEDSHPLRLAPAQRQRQFFLIFAFGTPHVLA